MAAPQQGPPVWFYKAGNVEGKERLSVCQALPPGDIERVDHLSYFGLLVSDMVCTMLTKEIHLAGVITNAQREVKYKAALEKLWSSANYWTDVNTLAGWFRCHNAGRWLQDFAETKDAAGADHLDADSYWKHRNTVAGGEQYGGVRRVHMEDIFYNGDKTPKKRDDLLQLLINTQNMLTANGALEQSAENALSRLWAKGLEAFSPLNAAVVDLMKFSCLTLDTAAVWKVNAKVVRFGVDHLKNFPLDTVQGHFWFRFAASFLGHVCVNNEFGRPYLSDTWLEMHMLNPPVRTVLNVADSTAVRHMRTRLTEHVKLFGVAAGAGAGAGAGIQLSNDISRKDNVCCFEKRYTYATTFEEILRMSSVVEDIVNMLSKYLGVGSLKIEQNDGSVDFGSSGAVGAADVNAKIRTTVERFQEMDEFSKWWPHAVAWNPQQLPSAPSNKFRDIYLSWLEFYSLHQAALLCKTLRDDRNYEMLYVYGPLIRQYFYLTAIAVTKFPNDIRFVEGVPNGDRFYFKVGNSLCGMLMRGNDLRNKYFAHPTEHLFSNYGKKQNVIVWIPHQPPNRPTEPIPELDGMDISSEDHFFSSSDFDVFVNISESVIQALFQEAGFKSPIAFPVDFLRPLPHVVCVKVTVSFQPVPNCSVHLIGDHPLLGNGGKLKRLLVESDKPTTIAFPIGELVKFRFACFDEVSHPNNCLWQSEPDYVDVFFEDTKSLYVVDLFPQRKFQVTFKELWMDFP